MKRMKIRIIFTLFICILKNNVSAQNNVSFGTSTGNIGFGTITPAHQLEVTKGDINIAPFNGVNYGYKMGSGSNSPYVLWHNGIPSSIYVGVGAGNANATNSNTFVGNNTGILSGFSGVANSAGSLNTFVGFSAGASNDQGYRNCFIGNSAGFSNTGGISNVFIGNNAGYNNTGSTANGSWNTIVGHVAGFNNITGFGNCFYGKYSGWSNVVGMSNSFFGPHSGEFTGAGSVTNNYNSFFGGFAGQYFNAGEDNLFLGHNAQNLGTAPSSSWNNISNATAVGANSLVPASNQMILGGNTVSTGHNDVNVGIGLSRDNVLFGPQNKLEINADPSSFVPQNGFDRSGLRFRQLTSASSNNMLAPYGKVLTVDANGDVVLTYDVGGGGGGGIGYGLCPSVYTLSGDIGMDLKTYRIYYEGYGNSEVPYDMNYAIGLGYVCGDPLPGKFSVNQNVTLSNVDVPTIAGYFHNGDFTTDARFVNDKRAIYGICDGRFSSSEFAYVSLRNIGGDFEATNSDGTNIAVRGRTGVVVPEKTYGNFGVGGWFESNNSYKDNIGVYAFSDGSGSGLNYGIYASAPVGFCNSSTCSDAAGFFNGDVFATTSNFFSDANLKDNIQPLRNGISVINALNPKTFTFRTSQFKYINLPLGIQDGLIAQEVQNVLPELVSSFKIPPRIDSLGNVDTTGSNTPFMAVNYIGIIPYLIGAVKDQQQSIDSLRTQLANVQSQINNCCGSSLRIRGNNGNIDDDNQRSTIDFELTNINTIILDQNSPNPFSEETFINYTIPKEVLKASIMIYDNTGQVLKNIVINERGQGTLHIYAEKLSNGIYTYSLIADGKTVDTKKMVCQK